jgi:hypothetical protein
MPARQIIEGREVPDLPAHAVKMLAILSRQNVSAGSVRWATNTYADCW